jgi:hypothetical protein
MAAVLTNINLAVENVREVQSHKADIATKIQLYGQPKAIVQDGNNCDNAVSIDTSAIFVATPDGVLHTKTAQGYAPVINHSSYYPIKKFEK